MTPDSVHPDISILKDRFSEKKNLSKRGVWLVLLLPCFIQDPALNANSEDPDQMPHPAAFDLGLHCLSMNLLWDARHKWVKQNCSR